MNLKIIYTPRGRADEYARQKTSQKFPPLACNLYTGCPHECIYCYAPDVLRTSRVLFHKTVEPKQNAIQRFEKDCQKLQQAGNDAPIFMSFTCDPCCPQEHAQGITRQAIRIAHTYRQRVNILTKGDAIATGVLPDLNPGDIFGVTITSPAIDKWEPYASPVDLRLKALQLAHSWGIETRVSFEPVIDPYSVLTFIPIIRPYTTLIQVGKLNSRGTMCQEVKELEKRIYWPEFAEKVKALLESVGGEYYLKDDLRKYLPLEVKK